ncbi:MAG: trypsin-like peptidase domain-containing protein [Planctomycetota bacterium]|nr:trypsin-like peptidase domain-containing protein [Planctomycetota bacterium]
MHPYSESEVHELSDNHSPRQLSLNEITPAPTEMASQGLARLSWFFVTLVMVLLAWYLLPMMIEQYQYAATKGKIRAEYDNAVRLLEQKPLESVSNAYELVAQKVRPSVVSIQTAVPTQSFMRNMAGQGSGVIMNADGHILTNAHVVQGAEQIRVVLHDRRSFMARQVGEVDTLNDLAVLKIDANNLIPAEWGESEQLSVGSIVWAVGSPFGYDQTVTSGIISAKDRMRRGNGHQQMLQTDAAVNPGNSGGPLVDAQGRVVGINTAIHGEQFQGISFAVPSEIAKFVFDQVIDRGYVDFGILGAFPEPVFQSDAERLNLPDIQGALIREVILDSPADNAGLQKNDVIRSWNGKQVIGHGNLFRFVDMTTPNTEIKLGVFRDGKEQEIVVMVGSRRQIMESIAPNRSFPLKE